MTMKALLIFGIAIASAMPANAQAPAGPGLAVEMGCVNCHGGAEFTNASVCKMLATPMARMTMGNGATAVYDEGFYNIGVRPTFDPPNELLEPHFFDFDSDLYGQEIEVAFHHFLRPEAKFDSLDALTAQMDIDCAEARRLLSDPS